jgi:hypothetical protein
MKAQAQQELSINSAKKENSTCLGVLSMCGGGEHLTWCKMKKRNRSFQRIVGLVMPTII